jgi:hypothetical protein
MEQWEEDEEMETTLLKKKNSIQDPVGNKENGYPVPDLNKKMINVTKSPVTLTQKQSKKFWKISLRNSWRRY